MKSALLCLTLAAAVAGIPPALADDWPQHRGLQRHGIADEAGLSSDWEQSPPREVWRRPIGIGYSAVTIADGRVFTMSLDGEEEVVVALDPDSGQTLWRVALGPSKASDMDDSGPRTTPTVHDGVVYTASSASRLVALDAEDGSLLWENTLVDAEQVPRFGYSVSPLVDGELVVVETGGSEEAPGAVALDRQTGEVVWTALAGPAGYGSPIVAELHGQRQYIFFRRVGAEVVSLSTEGEVLWRHETTGLSIITTPIFLAPDRIFVATADDAFGGLMLEISHSEGTWAAGEVWKERLMRNHFNTAVHVAGHLYGFDNGTFRCLDAATGEKRWAKRGLGKGSLVASGSLLYVLADDGSLLLVEASPEGFNELGRVQAMSGRAWTAPSLANGRIYMRDFDEVVAYDLTDSGGVVASEGDDS